MKIGKFKLPEVMHWIIPGFIFAYIYTLPPAAQPGYSFKYPGGGLYAGSAFIDGFKYMTAPDLGIMVPIAIAATAGDLMCLVSAYTVGDPYPIGETLVVDGLFTMLGAFFGS